MNVIIKQNRRAWLTAAFVVFFGISCASNPIGIGGPVDEHETYELQVDVDWRVDLATDRPWQVDPRELGTPVIAPGGHLLVGASNGWVYRIMSHSGEVEWGVPVGGSVDPQGALASNRAYIGTAAGELVSLQWRDGEELWRFGTRGSVDSVPTVANGRVFVTDSNDVLYALDALSGELLWDYERSTPEFFTIKGGGSPLVVGDVVYVGFEDGILMALYADSGEEIWSVYLGEDSGEFGDIDLPIILDEDRLIVASHAGGIYSVERETGALLWHVDVDNIVGLRRQGSWIFGATATGRILALDSESGAERWQYRLPSDESPMGISSAGRYLAVPVANGPLYWLETATGRPVMTWNPSSGFQNAPVFGETRGYIMSNRGYLYGFGLAY